MEPTYAIEEITPELARAYLATSLRNRSIALRVVNKYAENIRSGQWPFTGDPIQFDAKGHLLNGHHRMHAIIEAGIPMKFLVVRGLEPEAQLSMDQGRKRTAGQQLDMLDYRHGNVLGAAVKLKIAWDKGYLFSDTKRLAEISTPEIVEWVEQRREFVDQVIDVVHTLKKIGVRQGASLAVALRLYEIDAHAAKEFFHALASRTGWEQGSPLLALDNKLRVEQAAGRRMTDRDIMAHLLKTWEFWRHDIKISKLQRPRGGWTADTFPVPR